MKRTFYHGLESSVLIGRWKWWDWNRRRCSAPVLRISRVPRVAVLGLQLLIFHRRILLGFPLRHFSALQTDRHILIQIILVSFLFLRPLGILALLSFWPAGVGLRLINRSCIRMQLIPLDPSEQLYILYTFELVTLLVQWVLDIFGVIYWIPQVEQAFPLAGLVAFKNWFWFLQETVIRVESREGEILLLDRVVIHHEFSIPRYLRSVTQ